MNAIMDAFEAHSTMSKQAIDSDKVRQGLKHILLGPAELYEAGVGMVSGHRDGGAS
jgi:type I restriction enzyme R subunit